MFKKIVAMTVMMAFLSVIGVSAYPLHAQEQVKPQQDTNIAKAQEQPGAVETQGAAAVQKGGKFPWLLVCAGVVVVGVLVYFLLIAKKSYTLTVTTAAGVNGTPVAGATSYTSGTVVNYAYTPQSGYAIAVTLDGAAVASSGTVTMDKAHTLAVTSSYDIRGTWNFTLTWSGSTPYSGIYLIFTGTPNNGNLTFQGEQIGVYTVSGSNVTLTFGSGSITATYTGTFSNSTTMSGTMFNSGGEHGTWSATKASSTSSIRATLTNALSIILNSKSEK